LKKRNISVSVETSLHIDWNKIQRCRGLITHYLVDLKHTDSEKFTRYTGGNLDLVLSNLFKLVDSGENITIRIPVIPDFNHTRDEIQAMIDYIVNLGRVKDVHFIPYHTLGIGKYNMLGLDYFGPKHPVAHSELDVYTAYAHSKGLKTRIGG